jgi:hypothetical protein
LGDVIYRYITSDQFSPECLLDCLDLSTEYQALEIANRVEASVYVWRRRVGAKPVNGLGRSSSARSSWNMVKDMMIDTEKRELLAERAEGLLICLKQRFPGLTQTSLDMSKIQYNEVIQIDLYLSPVLVEPFVNSVTDVTLCVYFTIFRM